MTEIGIMQGRLSPPTSSRTQAFPGVSWEAEFPFAKQCGFDAIERLFEADGFERNPVWTAAGRDGLLAAATRTGIRVRSLCAHYFMAHPFFRVSAGEQARSVAVLEKLVDSASAAGIATILVPVLEIAELRTRSEEAELLRCLERPLDLAAARGIRIGFETELPATDYRRLVAGAGHAALGVYYDTGNAAVKGFDAGEENSRRSGIFSAACTSRIAQSEGRASHGEGARLTSMPSSRSRRGTLPGPARD